MNPGERQVSPDIEDIRADHINRYLWAIDKLPRWTVIDAACGVGYGSWLMAKAGFHVGAMDIDHEAIECALTHYAHPNIEYSLVDLCEPDSFDYPVVAFEIIEHIENPLPFLSACSGLLLASVPNETVFPYRNYKYHYRHYTKDEFEALLNEAGYEVDSWYGQEGMESEVEENVEGRTLIAMARKIK